MKRFLMITTAAILLNGCHKNAITGRRSLNFISNSEMNAMSFSEYDKFLAANKPLPDNNPNVILVRSVGAKIQKSVEKYYADKGLSKQLEGFAWAFNVVDDPTVNAWCMPGGKVVVYTGILPVTQDEKSLAVVMGHEIAHAIAQHGNERMSNAMMVQLGGAVLSTALQTKPQLTHDIFMQSFGITSQLGMLSYSRSHESEADKMGVIFAAMAGYDPRAAITFWERMSQTGGEKPPQLLSTHPSDETRVNDLKGYMKDALPYYEATLKR